MWVCFFPISAAHLVLTLVIHRAPQAHVLSELYLYNHDQHEMLKQID